MRLIIACCLIMLLVSGCAGLTSGTKSPDKSLLGTLSNIDKEIVRDSRAYAKEILKTWEFNSGFIRKLLGPKMGELKHQVVAAMDEMDVYSAKYLKEGKLSDRELGEFLALDILKTWGIILQAIELYTPDFLKYIPGVFQVI